MIPYNPTGLTANGVSSDQINRSWTSVSGTTGFQIQRMVGDCASVNPWKRIKIVGAKTTYYSNTGLSSGMTYSYRVRAYVRSKKQPYAFGYSLWSNCDDATTP